MKHYLVVLLMVLSLISCSYAPERVESLVNINGRTIPLLITNPYTGAVISSQLFVRKDFPFAFCVSVATELPDTERPRNVTCFKHIIDRQIVLEDGTAIQQKLYLPQKIN